MLAIYTTKFNYARFAEADDLIQLRLDAMQAPAVLATATDQTSNEADFRQVLLWAPAVKPQQNLTLNFQTSDIQGRFKLKICGITKEGALFAQEQYFEVY